MRIALFGQAAFGKDVFDALIEAGEQIVGVSTPREREGTPADPLREAAEGIGLPTIPTRELRKEQPFEAYRAWEPELIVFAFVTDIVRSNVLETATHGAIQYHPSLLPKHRGRSAMNWPIIAGATTTGLTIFWVDEGVDTGPILLQREVAILPDDTVGSLYFERLYPMGIEALVEGVRLVREGAAPRIEQDHDAASYDPPAGPEHGAVDWSRPGTVVHNHIRGCEPQPGAYASLRGVAIRLFGSHFEPGHPGQQPGVVVDGDGDGAVTVAAIGGTIRLARAQSTGRKVPAVALLSIGDRLERGEPPASD